MSADSQGWLFLLATFDIISSTTVLGVLYGIAFTLYCLCAQSWYPQLQDPDKRRQARFTLGYISLVLFCATAILALNARVIQLAYINHADYPGGPLEYEASHNPTINSYPVAGNFFNLIVEILTTAIQLWRLWIMWGGTRYAIAVTFLPLLLLLAYIVLDVALNIAGALLPQDQFNIPPQTVLAIGATRYAVLSAFTILVTGLIIARILLVRRCNIKLMGPSDASSSYMSIVAILIESYALESVWSVATAISLGLISPGFLMFEAGDPIIKIIAYFLVVIRVASGRAWTRDTGSKLTSLQFDRGAQTAIDEASGIRSQVPVTTVAVAVGSQTTFHSESAV